MGLKLADVEEKSEKEEDGMNTRDFEKFKQVVSQQNTLNEYFSHSTSPCALPCMPENLATIKFNCMGDTTQPHPEDPPSDEPCASAGTIEPTLQRTVLGAGGKAVLAGQLFTP